MDIKRILETVGAIGVILLLIFYIALMGAMALQGISRCPGLC